MCLKRLLNNYNATRKGKHLVNQSDIDDIIENKVRVESFIKGFAGKILEYDK